MKDKLKLKLNLPLLLIFTILTTYYVVKDSIHDVKGIISSSDILLIILAFLVVIIGDLFKSKSIHTLSNKCEAKLSFKDSLLLVLETNFFNGVTPFALGGQPFQLYLLKHKNKVGYVKGANIIFCDYYAFQLALLIYVCILFILNLIFKIVPLNEVMNSFLLVGFIMHIGLFSFLIYAAHSKNNNLAISLVHIGSKLHIVKNEEKERDRIVKKIAELKKLSLEFKKDKDIYFKTLGYNFLKLTFHSLAIYFVLASIRITRFNIISCLIVGVFAWCMSSFVPIPGATGGMEFAFITMFSQIIEMDFVKSGVILWRFSTYFLPIIVGSIIFVIINNEIKKTSHLDEDDD